MRRALGERVAGLVALHVEAKRYLVADRARLRRRAGADSVASLGRQGGALPPDEVAAFAARPSAAEAVALRRADDRGKVEALVVRDLDHWVPLLQGLSEQGGTTGS